MSLIFRLMPLRFTFTALEPIQFAKGNSANILRGAFGTIFRRIACVPECAASSRCERRHTCPYARMFEPSAVASGPSGLADWPRPFVFRATHLDGCAFKPNTSFHFDFNLFDIKASAIDCLVRTFAELAHDGLGPLRRKVELTSLVQLNESGQPHLMLYEGPAHEGVVSNDSTPEPPLELDLSVGQEAISRVRVKFITPTELKGRQQLIVQPEFGALAARVRDRISTLRELYDDGPLDIDFQAFGERASQVEMIHCDIRHVEAVRRSSRTGQRHSIGGFVGEAEYAGELGEFVPYLKAAQWTGVGRQTVWGKGEIVVSGVAG